jgi:hypothetical protein
VTVVVPTHDTRTLVLRCVQALAASAAGAPAIIVVDDGSDDGTADAVRAAHPAVRVLRLAPARGFTGAANLGLAAAESEILLLLNSDTEIHADALVHLVAAFDANPRLGAAAPALVFADGRPQWSAGREPSTMWLLALASGAAALAARLPGYRRVRPLHPGRVTRVDWVPGAALAMRRVVWNAVGPFDERFRTYAQDLDWCVRVRDAGWEIALVPDARVMHVGGASIGRVAGAVGSAHPERLWSDLVRWVAKRHGAAAALRATRALRFGAAVRITARRLALPLLPAGARARWRADTDAYRRARAALATPSAIATS